MCPNALADPDGVDRQSTSGGRWGAYGTVKKRLRSVKKLATNNIKRFSYHRGKDEVKQNAETQFWNGLISEFALGVAIKVLELISEGI
jgi:hypothetical protein